MVFKYLSDWISLRPIYSKIVTKFEFNKLDIGINNIANKISVVPLNFSSNDNKRINTNERQDLCNNEARRNNKIIFI